MGNIYRHNNQTVYNNYTGQPGPENQQSAPVTGQAAAGTGQLDSESGMTPRFESGVDENVDASVHGQSPAPDGLNDNPEGAHSFRPGNYQNHEPRPQELDNSNLNLISGPFVSEAALQTAVVVSPRRVPQPTPNRCWAWCVRCVNWCLGRPSP